MPKNLGPTAGYESPIHRGSDKPDEVVVRFATHHLPRINEEPGLGRAIVPRTSVQSIYLLRAKRKGTHLFPLPTPTDDAAQEPHLANRIRIRALRKLAMDAAWRVHSVHCTSGDGELAVGGGMNVLDAVQGEDDLAGEHAEVFRRSCGRRTERQSRRL